MKKAFFLGLTGSFFFAFTFILNRSMHLSGGSWIWSASLRYLFTFPIFAFIVWKKYGFSRIHGAIAAAPGAWLLWSTVGFGLFYAPLSFAGDLGESWLIAASWQITIVMGLLLAPLFGKGVPVRNLGAAGIILLGVFLLQLGNVGTLSLSAMWQVLLPVLVAAAAYPLGNRKTMALCGEQFSTIERIYCMTLCSLPFWLALGAFGLATQGPPAGGQVFQAFLVALFSGVAATLCFFRATDLVRNSQRQLAVVESTQSGEVVFTLLGGVLFLDDALPAPVGFAGIFLIVVGMILNSFLSAARAPRPAACGHKRP